MVNILGGDIEYLGKLHWLITEAKREEVIYCVLSYLWRRVRWLIWPLSCFSFTPPLPMLIKNRTKTLLIKSVHSFATSSTKMPPLACPLSENCVMLLLGSTQVPIRKNTSQQFDLKHCFLMIQLPHHPSQVSCRPNMVRLPWYIE